VRLRVILIPGQEIPLSTKQGPPAFDRLSFEEPEAHATNLAAVSQRLQYELYRNPLSGRNREHDSLIFVDGYLVVVLAADRESDMVPFVLLFGDVDAVQLKGVSQVARKISLERI
jgi:hypothetical protein